MRHRVQRQNLKDIRTGRRDVWEAAICQNYKSIYCFMAYLTGDTSLAEDLTQEAFASAWAKIGQYKGDASLGTWLHRIAYHKFIDSKRRSDRQRALAAKLNQADAGVSKVVNPLG